MPALLVRVLHQTIFFKRLMLWNQRSYIGEMHLKVTTRARAFYMLKNRIKTTLNDLGIRLLLDSLKSDSTALVQSHWLEGSPQSQGFF